MWTHKYRSFLVPNSYWASVFRSYFEAPENGLFGGISLYICNDLAEYMLKLDVGNKTTKLKYKKFKFTDKITAEVDVQVHSQSNCICLSSQPK